MATTVNTHIVGIFVEPHAEHTSNFVHTNARAVAYVHRAMQKRAILAFAFQGMHHFVHLIDSGNNINLTIYSITYIQIKHRKSIQLIAWHSIKMFVFHLWYEFRLVEFEWQHKMCIYSVFVGLK